MIEIKKSERGGKIYGVCRILKERRGEGKANDVLQKNRGDEMGDRIR